jgi:uncharacterized protein YqeY
LKLSHHPQIIFFAVLGLGIRSVMLCRQLLRCSSSSLATSRMGPSLVRFSSASAEPPIMGAVRQSLKDAMKAGDAARKTTIRAVMAALKNANIDKPNSVVTDIGFYGLINSLIKKREKSIDEYKSGNRLDLVDMEQQEIDILKQLQAKIEVATDEQVSSRVSEFIAQLGVSADDKAAMGKIMSKLSWSQVESEWKASQGQVVKAIKQQLMGKRSFSTIRQLSHENPLVCK